MIRVVKLVIVVAYYKELSLINLHDLSIRWSCEAK